MAVGLDWIATKHAWPLLIPGYGGSFGPIAIAQALFGDFSPSGKLPYTVYPEAWATNTAMVNKSLLAGDGRTYKWYNYKRNATLAPPTFSFGTGVSYSMFNVMVHPHPDSQLLLQRKQADQLPTHSDRIQHGTGGKMKGVRLGDRLVVSFNVTTTNTGGVTASDAILVCPFFVDCTFVR